jgi:solute carrier family 35 protein E3
MANTYCGCLQVWAGSKQKELKVNGNQLLHQVSPIAVLVLGSLIPVIEPVGWTTRTEDTILGYRYSSAAVIWILFSSLLGLVVTLSTYLFIGVTSALTYNVVVSYPASGGCSHGTHSYKLIMT